ncbi:hypothetical protein NIES4102_13700 [Chondrocystis sp. NIES-4102]|nr:hypothetical protein NIES4102_13700 [Chondrocystis sp. NIES-4102]
MFIKFTKLSTVLLIASIFSLFSTEAIAETKSLDQAFKEAYFSRGKNAFQQSTIFGQINAILGFTGFPDQHINVDSKKVDTLYQEAMRQQAKTGRRIITEDLPNPYNTSLQEISASNSIK